MWRTSPADISEVICDHVNMVSGVIIVIIVTVTTVSTVAANVAEGGQSELLEDHDIRQSAAAAVTAVLINVALFSLYCSILADMGNVMLCTRERSVSRLPTSSVD